jgi:hypothetical protein
MMIVSQIAMPEGEFLKTFVLDTKFETEEVKIVGEYFEGTNKITAFELDGETYKSTTYDYKHYAKKNLSWGKSIKATKNGGAAVYKLDTNVAELEANAIRKGIKSNNGKNYYYYDAGKTIGASEGKETQYMRAEIDSSDGSVHSHPILEKEYKQNTKNKKK